MLMLLALNHKDKRYPTIACIFGARIAALTETLSQDDEARAARDRLEDIVDTTAAGDSFNAGFFSAYLSGNHPEQAIQNGAKLAAKVITQRGALVSIFTDKHHNADAAPSASQ